MARPFKKKYIPYNVYSRPMWKLKEVRAIVVHYTANANSSADADSHYRYFKNLHGRYASAHYFVDKHKALQIIPDDEVTFQANDGGYSKLSYLRGSSYEYNNGNANLYAIGVEMCLENDGSIHPDTVERTRRVVAYLQNRYNIPTSRVVRHYDITGKNCPAPWVRNYNEFVRFKSSLNSSTPSKPSVSAGVYRNGYVAERGELGRATVKVSKLNVRKSASFNSGIYTTISKGETYRIYAKKNGLLKLTDGQWITANEKYIDYVYATQEGYVSEKGEIGKATVTVSELNVRKSASFNSGIYTTIKAGETYRIYAKKNGLLKLTDGQWITANEKYINYIDAVNKEADKTAGDTDKYKVKKGDTFWSIAQKYDLSVSELKKLNNRKSNTLQIGEILNVSVPNTRLLKVKAKQLYYYGSKNWNNKAGTVSKGDVFTIKREHKVSGHTMYELISGTFITANEKYVELI